MSANYVKQTWTDGVSSASAARFGVIEDGIYDAHYQPAVRVYHNANQAITSASQTPLAFNSERFDQAFGAASTQHDVSTNNSRLICRHAGVYMIGGHAAFDTGTGGTARILLITLNGATGLARQRVSPQSSAEISVSTIYALAVSDYVTLDVFHDHGSNQNIVATGNYSPEFWMFRVG